MSLNSALISAVSGLRVSQAGIDLVARNVANASTPGYTKKTLPRENALAAGEGIGVTRLAVQRQVDAFLQQQLRIERGISSSLDVRSTFLQRIDQMFGRPEDGTSVAGRLSALTEAFQTLATNPESPAAQQDLLNDADLLASELRSLSSQVQRMRLEAERSIAAAVEEANALLATVADINTQIATRQNLFASTADLEDERDKALDRLSALMDIRVVERDDGTASVFTSGGNLLLDDQPVTLSFDERTSISAASVYSNDPTQRGVGTITLLTGGGGSVDLIASGAIRSGEIAGYLELRDDTLVETQAQLDELAHALALSLSEETVAGTAATAGAQTGFDLNIASLQSGNRMTLTYTVGGTQQTLSIIAVTDTSVLPLPATATADPNDAVVGIDITDTPANIAAAINAVLPAAVQASNPAGTTIRFLDDGGAGTSDVDALSATVTPTALTDQGTGLALFVDDAGAQAAYTGSFDGIGQKTGFAARIAVNQDVINDPSRLIVYSTAPQTAPGDPTRPLDLLARLTENTRPFDPATGLGGTGTPLDTSVDAFARRVVSFQSSQAANVERDRDAQEVVTNALQEKFDLSTGVNVDEEMAELLLLQNSYAANARILSVVQDLMNVLLSLGR